MLFNGFVSVFRVSCLSNCHCSKIQHWLFTIKISLDQIILGKGQKEGTLVYAMNEGEQGEPDLIRDIYKYTFLLLGRKPI